MEFRPRRRFASRLAMAAILSLATAALAAWQAPNRNDPDKVPDVFVPASRDLQLQLGRARKLLEEGSYADASDLLGSLIAVPEADRFSPDAEDYFLDAVEGGGTFRSLKSEVLRLLGAMPAKGREAYEIRFGGDAKALVDAAVESGDIEKLTEAARMYFHTNAGYEAMLLLARYHYLQGRPLAAALCAERVAQAAGASACEPEASILLASAWWSAGYPDRAKAALVALRKKAPRAQVKIEGKPKPLFTSDDRALDWLREILPEAASLGSADAQENWVMHRGDPSRNAESKGGAPVRTPIWQALPIFDPDDEAIIREVERSYREQPTPVTLLSVLQPLAIGNDVIMRLPDRVVALDFTTGKAKWEYPWDDSAKSFGPPLEMSRNQTNDRDKRRRFLTTRIWEDSAHGQLASDGESLYFLDGHEMVNPAIFGNRLQAPAFGIREFSASNSLVCLELQSEGRQKWVVGGASGEDEPRLAGAWFLGAPLAMQGQVFILAEMMGEVRLVVLDADTGQLSWWQQLCQVDDFSPINNDSERKMAGCTPSFADGVLVCPTSAGAVVAVDIATRSLIWGHRYQSALQRKANAFQIMSPREIGKRWIDCSVTIAEGKVLVCTPDTDELHCLDLLTGKRLWGPTPRNQTLYVACVRNDAVYLVNSESMTALRMNDPASAWKSAISLKDSRPSGRGFVDHDFYYLPVENSQILKIDLAKGQIVDRIPTAFPLGNLVCHKDTVIAQSTRSWLSLFHQLDPLRSEVAKRLTANPGDAWALARQGEILAHDGKPREAIASLRASLEKEPRSRTTRSIMARTMLTLLRENFAGNPDLAREAVKYVDRPEDRSELLQLELSGLIKTGSLAEAFDRLMQLAVDSERPGVPATGELIEPPGDPARRVTRDRWQRGLLLEMWAKAPEALRAKMAERFALEASRLGPDVGAERLSRFVDLFGGFPNTEAPLIQLIKLETNASNYLHAEMLIDLLRRFGAERALATADALALDVAIASSQPQLAAESLQALRAYKNAPELLDGRKIADLVQANETAAAAAPSTAPWPSGAVLVEKLEERPAGYMPPYLRVNYRIRMPDSRDLASISIARTYSHSILVRDRFGGELVRLDVDQLDSRQQSVFASEVRQHARVRGNYLLLSQGFQLLAMDLHRSAAETDSVQLWSNDIVRSEGGGVQGARNGQRMAPLPNRSPLETTPPRNEVVYATADRIMGQTSDLQTEGVCFHRGFKLVCVAPLSGKILWERSDVPIGFDLFADESTLVVADRDSRDVRRFRLADGAELAPARLEEGEKVWTGLGSRVLTSQIAAGGKIVVRLWSFAEETPRLAWSEELPAKSVGCLIDGVEVGFLAPGGKLTIYPLDEARAPIRQTIDVSDGMSGLQVQRTSGAYYLFVQVPAKIPATVPKSSVATVPLGGSELFHGAVTAIGREQGELLWPAPAKIDLNGLVTETIEQSPVLIFTKAMRKVGTPNERITRSAWYGAILIVDKATGRNLYEQSDFGLPGAPSCRVELNRKANTVNVYLNASAFSGIQLIYTDGPRPPQPPAQTGSFTSQAADEK